MGKNKSTMSGASILWNAWSAKAYGSFLLPGGAILPAYDALKHSKIHHVLVRHEQGATHMADGYARASGEVGVAIATSGPGATNMVTASPRHAGFDPHCLHHRAGGSKLIGSDAFKRPTSRLTLRSPAHYL